MEKYEEVKSYFVTFKCKCGGNLEFTGVSDTKVKPMLYQHRCPACGQVKVFEKKYPATEFLKDAKEPI